MNYFVKYLFSSHRTKILLACFISSSLNFTLPSYPQMRAPAETQNSYFPKLDAQKLKKFLSAKPLLTCLNDNKPLEYLIDCLRDKTLDCAQFRDYSHRMMRILLETVITVQDSKATRKESPLGHYDAIEPGFPLSEFCAVTILRAGNSFLSELFNIFPGIPIGQVLIQRNEETSNKEPIFYYSKLPTNIQHKKVLICDPMVGTGGSLCMALKHLTEKGVKEENMTIVSMIGCFEGIERIYREYPKVKMVIACIESEGMTTNKYIAPGVGDFGDRYFGTN